MPLPSFYSKPLSFSNLSKFLYFRHFLEIKSNFAVHVKDLQLGSEDILNSQKICKITKLVDLKLR